MAPEFDPRLFGDEFDEQKLSIDTESLPVLDFLIVGGLHVGDSSKFMSWTSCVTCWMLCCCCLDVMAGGAGIFGGTVCSNLVCVDFSVDFKLLLDPKRLERMLIDFWLPDFLIPAETWAFGGGGLGGAGFFDAKLFTAIAWLFPKLLWLLTPWFLFGGGGAGRVGMVIVDFCFLWEKKW
jgi:hypothetical protein